MDKPPILSTEQVIKWLKDNYGENAIIAPLAHGKAAQRDADVEHYEPIIANNKKYVETLLKQNDIYFKRIEQARQDTAREIFEDIHKLTEIFYIDGISLPVINTESLQSLKSKYLIPPNPVGSADI